MDIVGREADLRVVGHFLDGMASGPRALVLTGEAGIGKSTVWQAALERARERGYRVISARPTEAEARLPFAALNDLFGALLDEVRPELAEPQQRALEMALLRSHDADAPSEPLALSLAVLNLVRAATGTRPLLIAVDDVPWIDGSSAAVLEFALRRLEAEPIGLLAAERTTGRGPSTDPRVLGAMEHGSVERLEITRLSRAALDRLLVAVLDLQLPPTMLARLHRRSGGNPFYAIELGRAVERRGTEVHDDLPLPDTLAGLIRERLSRLSAEAAQVALYAAALSQPTRAIVQRAIGAELADAGLSAAEGAGVLSLDWESIRFAHPLLAAGAYGRASQEERRAVHRTLAGLVGEPEEHAKHLALAADGPDEGVAQALELAAERAARRGAPDAAAELSEQAASLTPAADAGAAHRRSLAAARHHLRAGDIGRARGILELLLEEVDGGPPRAAILTRLAEVRQLMDDWQAARGLFEEALRHTADDVRQEIEIRLFLAGVSHITQLDREGGERHVARAMQLAEDLGDPEVLAGTIGHYATWQFSTGHGIRRDLMDRAEELEPWAGHIRTMDHPDFDFAVVLLADGDLRGFRERMERLVARAERGGDYSSLSFVLANLAPVDFTEGRIESAMDRLDRAERLTRATGQRTGLAHALACRVTVLARMGDETAARRAAAEGLQVIAETGWRQGESSLRHSLALLELSLGRASDAHEHLAPLTRKWLGQAGGSGAPHSSFATDVEALAGLGRLDEARTLLDVFDREARRYRARFRIAVTARARGFLLAAEGDSSAAIELLEDALRQFEEFGDAWEQARTLLMLGDAYRRDRKRAKARDALTRAAAQFERLQARLWAARARADLARITGRRDDRSGLTPTQLKVAELVSAGRSNREVAEALFMSTHTVEAHLTAIYRASGVRSRAELAQRLRDSAGNFRDSAATGGADS
ncbi:MAG TPA: AAA family ATPase [Candidatus Limnocylindria bacterium]